MSCGVDRNFLVYDSKHEKFSSYLVDLMIQAGDDNKSPLTHLIISPEAHENVDCVTEINDVKLLALDEMGVGQEYQLFYENQMKGPGGAFSDCCKELVIGIAHGKDGAMFVQSTTNPLIFKLDTSKDKQGYVAYFDNCFTGYVCEETKVVLGSF